MTQTIYDFSHHGAIPHSAAAIATTDPTSSQASYRLFKQNLYHVSLHFKPVHPARPIYSVRIGLHYRAVGIREEDVVIWYWIGTHADYERLISRL